VDSLPNDWFALTVLVFVLGLKHGLDADHLVAIDGLTRFNGQIRPRFARWCGVLFSLGHGAIVLTVALAIGIAAERWIVPGWVEDFGFVVSIGFLTVLGLLNLWAVLGTPVDDLVHPVGVRGRLFGRLMRASHPVSIALVGALFAVSFDTLSQAALFAVTANQFGGWEHAAVLGLLFMLGMMLADGANGLWIASLLHSADARARIASRVLGLAVAALSLGVAAFAVAERFSQSLAAWGAGRELALSLVVIAVVASASLAGLALARRAAPAVQSASRAR
jgi:high-affinity nickel-transport protein